MKYSDFTISRAGSNQGHKFFYLWLLALMLLSPVAIVVAAPAGSVVFVNGHVSASSATHGERTLSKDDPVFNSDTIDTAANGRGQLRFTDGGLVSLMPNTIFSVEEYFFEDEANSDSAVFGLLKGGLRTITGSVGKVKHEEYELKTPVATLGIRGTEYVAVIQPANTLRVHVGRGKVVITNEYGSLDVPAGRNAVVSLGSAPQFSEKGPVFVATAPAGDKLYAGFNPNQNPNLVDPELDKSIPDYISLSTPDNAIIVPANIAINGSGVVTTGSNSPGAGGSGPTGFTPMIAGGYYDDNWANGISYVTNTSNFSADGANNDIKTSNNYLVWGNYSAAASFNSVTLDGNTVSIGDSDFSYVTGNAAVDYVPAGQLNYSLTGGVYPFGNYQLNQFDLGINLGQLSYSLGMDLQDSSTNYSAITSGALNAGSKSQGFGFTTTDIVKNGTSCAGNCILGVQGFMAGPNAEAAGVGFSLTDTGVGIYAGAAALEQQ